MLASNIVLWFIPVYVLAGQLWGASIGIQVLMKKADDRSTKTFAVVDRTGLTGSFDIDLKWTPDQIPQEQPGPPPPGGPPLVAIDPNGPSIFTAVQEQLGLKLESTKGPVDVVVIDRVEQPTED